MEKKFKKSITIYMVGITGHNGVLGKILKQKLKTNNIIFKTFDGDITNYLEVYNWINKNTFTHLFHFAAKASTKYVEENTFISYETNVGGIINLCKAIIKSNKKIWIFYSSTSHVYKSKKSPILEDDKIEPINLYGYTKYCGEEILRAFYKQSNSKICIGRIFSFYHKTQLPPFLYPSILKRLETEDLKKPFDLKGANSKRDISNAEDIVEIIIKLMEKNIEGTYNIGNGKGVSIKKFVQSLTKTKLNFKINNKEKKTNLIANISKLQNVLK